MYRKETLYICSAKDVIASSFNRTVEITFAEADIPIVYISKDAGTDFAIVGDYKGQIGEVENPGGPKAVFLADETYPERFKHVLSASSHRTQSIVDMFYDYKYHVYFFVGDLNHFDPTGEMDSNTGFSMTAHVISGDRLPEPAGEELGSKTILITSNIGGALGTAYDSNYGDPKMPECAQTHVSQYISFPSGDVFKGVVPVYMRVPVSYGTTGLRKVGARKDFDALIQLDF